MTFKAIQTYSDGQVVSWIEEPAAGSNQEPEHPAPTLTLAPASDSGAAAPANNPPSNTAAATVTASGEDASQGSVTGAYVVGGIGLLAGLAALGLALTGRRRRASLDRTPDRVSTGV